MNLKKTVVVHSEEVSSFPHLSTVQAMDLKAAVSGFKVLGVPMANPAFVKSDLDLILAKVQFFCDRISLLDHPQARFPRPQGSGPRSSGLVALATLLSLFFLLIFVGLYYFTTVLAALVCSWDATCPTRCPAAMESRGYRVFRGF